jgi:hypothetical protein
MSSKSPASNVKTGTATSRNFAPTSIAVTDSEMITSALPVASAVTELGASFTVTMKPSPSSRDLMAASPAISVVEPTMNSACGGDEVFQRMAASKSAHPLVFRNVGVSFQRKMPTRRAGAFIPTIAAPRS